MYSNSKRPPCSKGFSVGEGCKWCGDSRRKVFTQYPDIKEESPVSTKLTKKENEK
jgi:hypothetical protein